MPRMKMLIAATSIAAASYIINCPAQVPRGSGSPPADLHPPVNLDADTLRAQFAPSHLGLKPKPGTNLGGITLPFGMDYNREAKGLLLPLDEKREWGVGVGLNLNAPTVVELSPTGVLGLQPKRAPGLMLNRKF